MRVFYTYIFIIILFPWLAHSQNQCPQVFDSYYQKPRYYFQDNESSKTLSQKIRDNHLDYQFFTKKYLKKLKAENSENAELLEKLLSYKGWVSGDNHAGNYAVKPLNGKMEYFFEDIKDGGYGPLFYNFANLALNAHAITKRTDSAKIMEVVDALIKPYLKGLKEKHFKMPSILKEALNTDLKVYEKLQEKEAKKYVGSNDRFNFDKNVVKIPDTKVNSQIKEEIEKHLTSSGEIRRVLDYAYRPKDRGGSRRLIRIWALSEKMDGQLCIMEFKEVRIPSSQVVEDSGLSLQAHIERLQNIYYPSQDPLINAVTLNNKLFYMRPKKIELVGVSYKIKSQKDLEKLFDLYQYASYTTGLKHAKYSQGIEQYVETIENNISEVRKIIKRLVKDYYDHIEEKVGN